MIWFLSLLTGLATYAATGDPKKALIGGLAGMIPGAAGALGAGGAAGAAGAGTAASGGGLAAMGATATGGAGAATAAGAGGLGAMGSQMMRWAQANPMQAAMLASTAAGAMGGESELPGQKSVVDRGPHRQGARKQIPYSKQVSSGPSTYTTDETPNPDDIYRYGQYGGEHKWFDDWSGSWADDLPEDLKKAKNGKKDGGMIKGPGTTRSDSIPAKGPGGRDIYLSNNEFVLPADVVAAMGDGDHEAGGRNLHAMINKVRAQTYGR